MASLHRQTLVDLVKQRGWTRGAELGVDRGVLTGMLLDGCPGLRLDAVDIFPDEERSHKAFELAAHYQDRLTVVKATTDEASDFYPDGYFDFVFVDADHSYEAVKSDIAHWASKVRKGGWFGGHDYHPRKWPGVVQAVNEAYGKRAHQLPGTIWGVWVK